MIAQKYKECTDKKTTVIHGRTHVYDCTFCPNCQEATLIILENMAAIIERNRPAG